MPKNKGGEYYTSTLFFVILQLKHWIETFYTYQWIDSDCLQAMGWPPLTFFDWLNLHFACRDRIGTGQNRPFYPCFGPHRGSRCGKKWFGMAHQIVRYVTQPLWPYAIKQKKRWHFFNGGESGFFARMTKLGISLNIHRWGTGRFSQLFFLSVRRPAYKESLLPYFLHLSPPL